MPTRSPAQSRGDDLRGWTLHRRRHSALTHDAESGTSTPTLPARSRDASVRCLERYAHPGVDPNQEPDQGFGRAASSPDHG
ncbi:hypothetical protein [Streptomyces diastatochromogenes]|uniref:hypothetical protein n=1 Tax=Streptomyces diastatochromogenes TaxID=42236 RepID=UPI001FC9402E|nr:hypothetical protein [Streptomyces diastatochromogenes]